MSETSTYRPSDIVPMSSAARRVRDAADRLARDVPDFPTKGVVFRDLTPMFTEAAVFADVVEALSENHPEVDVVAGLDARGFMLAGGVAAHRGWGMLAIRKTGKLPPPVHTATYTLEYGEAALEIPAEHVDLTDKKVLVVDDVLATGGTCGAAVELVRRVGGTVVGAAVLSEIPGLGGRERFRDLPLTIVMGE